MHSRHFSLKEAQKMANKATNEKYQPKRKKLRQGEFLRLRAEKRRNGRLRFVQNTARFNKNADLLEV